MTKNEDENLLFFWFSYSGVFLHCSGGDDNDEWLQCFLFWAAGFFSRLPWSSGWDMNPTFVQYAVRSTTAALQLLIPFHTGLNMPLSAFFWTFLSLFTCKVQIKWSFISFTVNMYIFFTCFLILNLFLREGVPPFGLLTCQITNRL